MCLHVLPAFMCMHHICAVSLAARRGHCTPRNEVTVSCEPEYECWKSDQDPLQKQPVLLAGNRLPSPQTKYFSTINLLMRLKTKTETKTNVSGTGCVTQSQTM